jgi:hypothetical protein
MKLIQRGQTNCHELRFANGNSVLFSYETVVAVDVGVISTSTTSYIGIYRTAAKYSATTTRHINAWTMTTKTLPQEELEALARLAALPLE